MRPRTGIGRRCVAAGALAGLIAGALVVASAAASRPSFLVPLSGHGLPGWLAGPLAGPGPRLDRLGFELLVVAMCVCYAVALLVAESVPRGPALAVVGVLHLVFFLGPPLLSPDVATYLAYARLALHGLDPYTHAPHALPPGDPLRAWVQYTAGPTNYGPPFTLLTYPLAHLGVPAAVWVLKCVATLASLGVVALVAACARLRGVAPMRAAFLYGLNPVVLIYAVGGAHNDLLMMVVLMTAVWLALVSRPREAGAASIIATGLKVSAAPATLFILLGSIRRRQAIAAAVVTAIVLAGIVLAGFGHTSVFVDYLRQLEHGSRAFARRYSVPALIGQALGLGGVHGVTHGVRLVAGASLVAWVLVLLVRLRRGGDWLSLAAWAQLAALLTTTWLWPWYVVWVLPLAAVARTRSPVAAALGVTGFLVITQVFLPLG